MGIENVKPLNIPEELWKFCDRKIIIDYCSNINGRWMLKDIDTIKSEINGEIYLDENSNHDKKYFMSEWIDNIDSEFRVFVFNGSIKGINCYLGNELILPDLDYIKKVVKTYNKRCYTLDVMVTENGKHTEILELHDFFSCGLYGFEDYSILPVMWNASIQDILRGV